jgi:hypothetical protein
VPSLKKLTKINIRYALPSLIFLKSHMAWTDDTNVILLEVIHATDPHNSNYGEKSKNWKEVIKEVKEILLTDLKWIALLNEQCIKTLGNSSG